MICVEITGVAPERRMDLMSSLKSDRKPCKTAMEDMGLSARAHDKILRIGRTIADMEEKETIEQHHLSEAINFRTLDRSFWQQ